MVGLRLWKAGRAGSRLDGGRREGGPVVGSLSPSHCFLKIDVQLLPVLGNANTVDPLLEGSDIITAEVLDILRLLLDLRVLEHHAVVCRSLVFALVVLAVIDINVIQLKKTHQVPGCLGFSLGNIVDA